MTDREQANFFVAGSGADCPIRLNENCTMCIAYPCHLSEDRCLSVAKQWLADHPEKPEAKPSPIYKGANRGESTYSLSLTNGRISLYRFHGQDSESVDFVGTVEDFNQFDEEHPEEWFDVVAKMIAGRK